MEQPRLRTHRQLSLGVDAAQHFSTRRTCMTYVASGSADVIAVNTALFDAARNDGSALDGSISLYVSEL